MSDLINRTKALEAIRAIDDHGDPDRANALGLAEWAVKSVPTEQTEIVCCCECDYMSWCDEQAICRRFNMTVEPDFFCADGERR